MNRIDQQLKTETAAIVQRLYGISILPEEVIVNTTRKEFAGDYSIVVFPFTKLAKKSPEKIGEEIGQALQDSIPEVSAFNTIKGFLNIEIEANYWCGYLNKSISSPEYAQFDSTGKVVVVEYCGPNTNKPLHLGHIRNMVIGFSMAEILKAVGHEVHKVNIYNDRGIAICKSMVAWLNEGQNKTPESEKVKGDHLVGRYYVLYNTIYEQEVKKLVESGVSLEDAKNQAPILIQAREMLRKWEQNDPQTLDLWNKMNGWVYEGFNKTFKALGVDFEKDYFESAHYLSGKILVEEGLKNGAFFKKEDGSVWVDLTDKGLDEKVLLRSDGTSVYLTQDLGTAEARYHDYKMDTSIYVVANEQDYHFNALKLTLQKLHKPYADGIFHLSYGMVDLPSGKMKSREGTTVDADDLMQEMFDTARVHTEELGKIDGFDEQEANELYRILGLGALKYYLQRVNPKKKMLFDPQESIQFQGDTGPFIQYSYARIQSVLKKYGKEIKQVNPPSSLEPQEKELIIQLYQFPDIIKEAAAQFDPSQVAGYVFALAKVFNKFYAELPILQASEPELIQFRLLLSQATANVIQKAMSLLGISVPERM